MAAITICSDFGAQTNKVSYDPLYFCVVCCDLSIFISDFIDLILLSLFLWAPKSLQMVTAAMKLKDICSLEDEL